MTYFVGAYWMQREESQAACALRISNFIIEISKLDPSLSHWFKQATTLKGALQTKFPIDANGLKPLLRVQRRDVGNDIIPELGYSFSAWNGNLSNMAASISVMCGGYSNLVGNSAVLSFAPKASPSLDLLKNILKIMVAHFEPEDGIVNSMERSSAHTSLSVLEIPSIYSYHIHSGFKENQDSI